MNETQDTQSRLKEIYRPIEKELKEVEEALQVALSRTKNQSILRINRFLLGKSGKKIRPALVILSAKAVSREYSPSVKSQLIKIASAIELIHNASLIHDDVIDHAVLRHNRPNINSKWGQDVSIAVGDYLYSKAFELVAFCNNMDILSCISQATRLMCEGELIQVCERDNISLLKERYLLIVKNKTASLFAASCQSGAAISNCQKPVQQAFKAYGSNIGIAFQITDDYLDLMGNPKDLGKSPGADFKMGEITLPVLNLLSQTRDKNRLISLFKARDQQRAYMEIKQRFSDSQARHTTKEEIYSYIRKAKRALHGLEDSCFKQSLSDLAEYIVHRIN
jgi:octaprenyl-diphosphate synthase